MIVRMLPVVTAAALALAAAGTAAAPPALGEPADLVARAGGGFLVTDRARGAVLQVDAARKTARRLARVVEARELAVSGARVFVTSRERVLTLDVRTGRTKLFARARAYILGLAPAPRGGVYASEDGATIVRIGADGSRTVLATGLDGVHGITPTPAGLVLAESFAGRVLRLDPATGKLTVLASGLGNPSFTLADGAALYVSEFAGGRVSRLAAGRIKPVATIGSPGAIAFDGRRRIVGVTLDGTIFRIERGRARTIYP
jgi:sugar lactone lactonase YvrE